MPPKDRPVLEVLFPRARARLLHALFRKPPRQLYVRELAGVTALSQHTVQDELRKLRAIGIVKSWSDGYHRFYGADQCHALHKHLAGVVQAADRLPKPKHAAVRRLSQKNKEKRHRVRLRRPLRHPRWGLFDSKYEYKQT